MLGKRTIHLSERLFGKTLLRQVNAVVGVTGEIAAYEKGRAPHLEVLCIPNGSDAGFDFALSIPSGESPVAVETIVAFWKDVSKRSDYGPTMRAYAQERLSWLVKAEKLKDWLAK